MGEEEKEETMEEKDETIEEAQTSNAISNAFSMVLSSNSCAAPKRLNCFRIISSD